jgi:hypothetical protein
MGCSNMRVLAGFRRALASKGTETSRDPAKMIFVRPISL